MEASAHQAPSRATPGRWVGGLVGVAACVVTIWVAGAIVALSDPMGWATRNGLVTPENLRGIALGGLPIAFLVGRALLPAARSGGWLTALGIGLVFGLIAPPLGAIEVVLLAMLPFSGSTSGFGDNVTGVLFILPIALVYSYIVVVVTVPAGLLWGVLVRAVPERVLRSVDLGRARPEGSARGE